MRNVVFSEDVFHRINQYSRHYRMYFEETYTDTGIWSEDMIVARYCELALERKKDLEATILHRIQQENIIGHSGDNTVTILWRKKNLHITYEDRGEDMRIVHNLEIR